MPRRPARKSDKLLNAKINVSTAAQILNVSSSTLRRLEKEGRITSVRENNGYRFFNVVDVTALKGALEEEKKHKKEIKTRYLPITSGNKTYSKPVTETSKETTPIEVEKTVSQEVPSNIPSEITGTEITEKSTVQDTFIREPVEHKYLKNPLKSNITFGSFKKAFAYPMQTAFIIMFVFILSNTLTRNPAALLGYTPLFQNNINLSFLNDTVLGLLTKDDINYPNVPFNKNLAAVLAGKDRNPNYIFNINIPGVFKDNVTVEGDLSVDGLTSLLGDLNVTGLSSLEGALNVTGLASLNGGLSTPSIADVTSIDDTTKTTLEETLELAGDVIGTLNNTQITGLNGFQLGDVSPEDGNILMVVDGKWDAAPTTDITELGTIGTGTWQGSTVATGYGGTGLTTYATGDMLYASANNTLSRLPISGTANYFLISNGTIPTWQDPADYLNTVSWLVTGNSGTEPLTNFLGTTDNQPLAFRTNDIERLRIDTNGYVGIGTDDPFTGFHLGNGDEGPFFITPDLETAYIEGDLEVSGVIYGTTIGPITNTGFDPYGVFYADLNGTLINDDTKMTFNPTSNFFWLNGKLGIGTTDPTYQLSVNGSLNTTSLYIGGVQVTSSAAELNILDGATLSTTELNLLDGRSGTLLDSVNVGTYATTGVTAGSGLTGGGTTGVLT